MSDFTDPQPTLDDLSNLIPEVIPNVEADPELVTIGERYWALAGFDSQFLDVRAPAARGRSVSRPGPRFSSSVMAKTRSVWSAPSR